MSTVAEVNGLAKRYGSTNAVDDVSFRLEADTIYGLLGRNGAGKTTIMSIMAAQEFETAGTLRVFGEHPYEKDRVLQRLCFIRESQKYPDDFKPRHAFKAASLFFPNWDQSLAERLIEDFALPMGRKIKKLSRGQLSAVGVIIGLACRAELTFFDEPYLGLDAVSRQLFYDRLIADYAEFPRTVVLSSHLIDEVAPLLEHVIAVDKGRLLLNEDTDRLRGSAYTVTGTDRLVTEFTAQRSVLHRDSLSTFSSATVEEPLTEQTRTEAAALDLEIAPVSLQQLLVRKTMREAESRVDPAELTTTADMERAR